MKNLALAALLGFVKAIHVFDESKGGLPNLMELPRVKAADYESKQFDNKVDHIKKDDKRTYKQRYWVSDQYVNPKDPKSNDLLFVHICGESKCEPETGLAERLGAQYNARLMTLEHRFYGESFPIKDPSNDDFRYLSSEQALADVRNFLEAQYKAKPFKKVVLVGCSYAGALVGWYAEQNANKNLDGSFVQMGGQLGSFLQDEKPQGYHIASWASSGVIHPLENFWGFDETVYTMTRRSSETCTNTMQKMVTSLDEALKKKESRDLILKTMDAKTPANKIVDGDIQFFLADMLALPVQYSNRTTACKELESNKDKPFIE